MTGPSDRAKVIHAFAWIEYFMWIKVQHEDPASVGGRRPTLAQMLSLARKRRWISRDVHDDLQRLREVRNLFAHSIEELTLSDSALQGTLNTLETPRREYYDWDEMGAAALGDGVVLFSGQKPTEAGEDLALGGMRFQLAMPIVIAVLIAEMKIPFTALESDRIVQLQLPPHMAPDESQA